MFYKSCVSAGFLVWDFQVRGVFRILSNIYDRSFPKPLFITLPFQENIGYSLELGQVCLWLVPLSCAFNFSCPFSMDKCIFKICQTVVLPPLPNGWLFHHLTNPSIKWKVFAKYLQEINISCNLTHFLLSSIVELKQNKARVLTSMQTYFSRCRNICKDAEMSYLNAKCYPTTMSLPHHRGTYIHVIHLNFLLTDHQIQVLKKKKWERFLHFQSPHCYVLSLKRFNFLSFMQNGKLLRLSALFFLMWKDLRELLLVLVESFLLFNKKKQAIKQNKKKI